MDSGDRGSASGSEGGSGAGEAAPAPDREPLAAAPSSVEYEHPKQSPLYFAHHADRYQPQSLIRDYERNAHAKLIVAIDVISFDFVQNVEEMLFGEDGSRELHVLFRSSGGDGEGAIRAVRSMQARTSRLVVIVPDIAKSAATLLALGADEIRVGPTSDLGPIDPQMRIGDRWFAAKAIKDAVKRAEEAVAKDRGLTPLWASLLADVSALDLQAAEAELSSTKHMVKQALSYRTNPPAVEDLDSLVDRLVEALQDKPTSHGTTLGARELLEMELPVMEMNPRGWEWEAIWRLWTLYFVQIGGPIYESATSSYLPEGPHPA